MSKQMITYEKALEILAQHNLPTEEQTVPLTDCRGYFLAENIEADRNFPPFDRVSMDGIALKSEVFDQGQTEFLIEDISPAGSERRVLKTNKNCIEVMTGTILPQNTDAIVPYEEIEIKDKKAYLKTNKIEARQYIHAEGVDIRQGEVILPRGSHITSAEINILASVGKTMVQVFKPPRAIILSTGNELIPVDQKPELFQIRRSNVYGIQSTLGNWRVSSGMAHLQDDKEAMYKKISSILKEYDVLIFTGAVSKGKFDYLPEILEALNIKKIFYKIKQRPGKPFWFGRSTQGNFIFALPGNPVSSFACISIYFRHWLLSSFQVKQDRPYHVKLKGDVTFTPDLTYFMEARVSSSTDGILEALPMQGNGSGDFVNLASADGFLILPREKTHFKRGETYPFVFYRGHR